MKIAGPIKRHLGRLARASEESRTPLYLVGGCVRDGVLKGAIESVEKDIDLLVEADARRLAEACVRHWGGRFEVFDRFGTVRIRLGSGFRVDIARARTETYPRPGALPVVRPATLALDLGRRDFSINAMAVRLTPKGAGPLIDFHEGAADLKARLVRVLHKESFSDDPTRLYRAARYAGRLGFRLDPETRALAEAAVRARLPARLSRERFRQELIRILEEKDPLPALKLLKAWGLDGFIFPKFRWPTRVGRKADAHHRLGLCALAMPGRSGYEFLDSLPIEHALGQALKIALKLRDEKASPRKPLPELTRGVLEAHFKKLPKNALRPLLITGADLMKLGLKPGKEFSRILDRAAREQWRGAFRTRAEALRRAER